MANSLPIPSPPATPNGDRWVEEWRTADEVFYSSEDGWASISLCLIVDKDGRRWVWQGHEEIVGLDMRAVPAEWDQSRDGDLAAFKPVSEPKAAPVPARDPAWYLGREAAGKPEPEPEPVDDVSLEELQPAPNTLYWSVPAEERRSFTRWLNS